MQASEPSTPRSIARDPLWHMVALCVVAAALSAWHPRDWFTWFFELTPGSLGVAFLVWLRTRFRFSSLVYYVVAVQYITLAVGAHYTYEHEPIFGWLKEHWGLARNHSDRLGHYLQGVTPAIITREVLLRTTNVRGWLAALLSASVAVGFSACYEIFEWLWVLAFYRGQGSQWLGEQGDHFDAQADMLMALLGALTVVIILAPWHNRAIAALDKQQTTDS